MHKLEKLLNNGEAELVLKLTENTNDFEELLFRTRALRMLDRLKDVPEVFDMYHDVLDSNLEISMPVHIDALILLNRFDDARKAISYYSNLPYQNQRVEEMLKAFPDYINREEIRAKSKSGYLSDEELADYLLSKDDDMVATGLQMIKERRVENFVDEIKQVMSTKHKAYVRGLALAILNSEKIDSECDFLDWNEKKIRVNPNKLLDPFNDNVFENVLNKIEEDDDITFIDIAKQVLFTYVLAAYPHKMDESADMIYAMVRYVTLDALSQSDDIEKLAQKYHLDKKKLEAHIQRAMTYIR